MPRRPHNPPSAPTHQDRHYPQPHRKIRQEGEMTVTGHGEVVIDEELKRSRALLVHSEEAVYVGFKEDEHCAPPCAGGRPDELRWELIERRRQLFLKIHWHVNSARTIIWKIYEVD